MQLILITLTDIVILFLLVYILIRLSRKESTELCSLKDSCEKLMSESEKVTQERLSDFNSKISVYKNMLSHLDEKYNSIRRDMLKAAEISEELNKISTQNEEVTEPYKKAVDMLATNTPVNEIKKKSGLSTSEIDLIKQLTQNKFN